MMLELEGSDQPLEAIDFYCVADLRTGLRIVLNTQVGMILVMLSNIAPALGKKGTAI